MSVYITSYHPLGCTRAGRIASATFGLPPFIDGSCRREPDFQHPSPCITSLCRPKFVVKLNIGDIIIYTTIMMGGVKYSVAVLEVIDKCSTHINAEAWYVTNGLPIPNNLIVTSTAPFPLNQTHQKHGMGSVGHLPPHKIISLWNGFYNRRSSLVPDVAICKHWKAASLHSPRAITRATFMGIFGRIPGTQNPLRLSPNEWISLQPYL